jgi:hypothetical protein
VSRDRDDANGGGNHRKNLRLWLETSRRRLRTDYLDIYWVGPAASSTSGSPVRPPGWSRGRTPSRSGAAEPPSPGCRFCTACCSAILNGNSCPWPNPPTWRSPPGAPLAGAILSGNLGAVDLVLPADAVAQLEAVTAFDVGFPTSFIQETGDWVFGSGAADAAAGLPG